MALGMGMGWGGLSSIVMEKGAGKPMAERLPESMDSNGVKSPNGFMVLALVF